MVEMIRVVSHRRVPKRGEDSYLLYPLCKTIVDTQEKNDSCMIHQNDIVYSYITYSDIMYLLYLRKVALQNLSTKYATSLHMMSTFLHHHHMHKELN